MRGRSVDEDRGTVVLGGTVGSGRGGAALFPRSSQSLARPRAARAKNGGGQVDSSFSTTIYLRAKQEGLVGRRTGMACVPTFWRDVLINVRPNNGAEKGDEQQQQQQTTFIGSLEIR